MKPRHVTLLLGTALAVGSAVATAQPTADLDAPATVAEIERTLIDLIARAEPSVVAVSRTAQIQQPLFIQGLGDAFGEFRRPEPSDSAPTIVGAGVLIDRSGLVLTHYLAVLGGGEHSVTTIDGNRYTASIRGADPRSGLAVLKIDSPASPPQTSGERARSTPGSFPALRLGDASGVRKGQLVVAIGNPFAIASEGQPTASWGIITNIARKAPLGTNFNNAPGANLD